VVSGWVNCRREPDTKSDIIGQPTEGTTVNVVAVKMFGTAVRGRLDTSGWVSIIATGGKVLFERRGGLLLEAGPYRTEAEQPLYAAPAATGGGAAGKLAPGVATLSEVTQAGGCIWGKAPGGWLQVFSPEHGVVADRIQPGFNDHFKSADEFEDPPAPNQMMLLSDMVLVWDEAFKPILQEYADDEELLKKEFGEAFKKLTELGCPFAEKA